MIFTDIFQKSTQLPLPPKTNFSSYATACVFEVARKKQPSRKNVSEKIDSSFSELGNFQKKNSEKTLTFVVFLRGVEVEKKMISTAF